MKKSAVLDLKEILVTLKQELGQTAHSQLCAEILMCWLETSVVGMGDSEEFAASMVKRFKNGKYPFN